MTAYYNENDPKAAAWLRELIKAELIATGEVDERSIEDVHPADLAGFSQCHFFAGIGGWSYALRLAGWPDDRPVWTGSCPCQPFSAAGKGKGIDDERHLWPAFRWLIDQCRPAKVFGEQVASRLGRDWLAGVRTDLETLGYAVGAADLCAAGVGAPHIRQRLFWVADAGCVSGAGRRGLGYVELPAGLAEGKAPQWERLRDATDHGRTSSGVADSETRRRSEVDPLVRGRDERSKTQGRERSEHCGGSGRLEHSQQPRLERHAGDEHNGKEPGRIGADPAGSTTEAGSDSWANTIWLPCADGKARRIEPGIEPLVDGLPGRVGLLRGYGNAIVPQVAAVFIKGRC